MEDPLHGRLNGIVVEIDGLWIVCAARGSEWLSGGEQGFDGFVVEDEERGHRLETGLHRLVAAGVADPADDVLAAEFLQIIGGGAGTARTPDRSCWTRRAGWRHPRQLPPRVANQLWRSAHAPVRRIAPRRLRRAHDQPARPVLPAQVSSCRYRNQCRERARPAGARPCPT